MKIKHALPVLLAFLLSACTNSPSADISSEYESICVDILSRYYVDGYSSPYDFDFNSYHNDGVDEMFQYTLESIDVDNFVCVQESLGEKGGTEYHVLCDVTPCYFSELDLHDVTKPCMVSYVVDAEGSIQNVEVISP